MTQSALSKERRELRQAQREAEMDNVPRDINKTWIDPVPGGGTESGKQHILFPFYFLLIHTLIISFSSLFCLVPLPEPYLATDFQQMAAPPELPEWKRVSFGGNKASYGRKTSLSILEQRHGLPIYKLRNELIEVRCRYFSP